MSFLFSPMGNPLLGDSMREYIFNGIGSFSPELSGKKQIFVETCSLAGKELNISAKQSGR